MPLKILWLNHRDPLNPKAGGAERTMQEVLTRLSEHHNVRALSPSWKKNHYNEEYMGIHFERRKGNVLTHLKALSPNDQDVLVEDLAHVVPWFNSMISNHSGTAFFRHLHSRTLSGQVSYPAFKFLSFIEKNYSRIYKKWPFVTESLQGTIDLQNLGIDPDRIVRIAPGVNSQYYTPNEKKENPSVVYFGGMRDYKRPTEILYVLKDLINQAPEIKLDMIGIGTSLTLAKVITKKLEISEHVNFRGHITNDVLRDILSRAWVNVHTSVAEGWGYSIMEASASGTPTVAYSVPGVSESVKDGVNGTLVPDGNRSELLNAIEDVLNAPKKMAQSSRHYAEKFSWDDSAKKWEDHLKKVTEGYYT